MSSDSNGKPPGAPVLFDHMGGRVGIVDGPTRVIAPRRPGGGTSEGDAALLRVFQRQLAVAQAAAKDLAGRLDRIKKAKDCFVDDIDDNGVNVVSPLILGDFLKKMDDALTVPETIEAEVPRAIFP